MYKSYITVALRNFWKDRSYALVNLIGLAVGFACVLMIVAYVRYELSYDTTYSNAPNVYRLVGVNKRGGTVTESAAVPQPLGKTLVKEYPEVAAFTSVNKRELEINNNHKGTVALSGIYTDSNFFKVFNFPFILGNAASALRTKESVVISESTANKIYPGENPIGKLLTTYDKQVYIIRGVIKDLPPNIHFNGDAFISEDITTETLTYIFWTSSIQYVLLQAATSPDKLQSKLPPFYKKYDFGDENALRFQPVQSIHLHSNLPDEQFANSDIKYVYIFSAIALLILFIACINYMNLTTARSLQRTREVGVRKVMGAGRGQLAFQFLTESFLFFGITLPVSILLAKFFWPSFASLLQLQANSIDLLNGQTILILLLIAVIAGLLSGLYPAAFLSGLQPVDVLKGWKSPVSLGLRKVLIVFQFVISIVLIIATIVVQMQLHFINNLNLGFNKDNLIVLPYVDLKPLETETFKNQLLSYKDINSVSMAGSLNIGKGYGASAGMTSETDSTKEWNFSFIDADFDFIKTMQIPIIEGRNFSMAYTSDGIYPDQISDSIQNKNGKLSHDERINILSSKSIIITRKTAELIELKKPYVGQIIKLGSLNGTLIGVVDDFKGMSLKQENPAIVIRAYKKVSGNTFIRINPNNLQQTLSAIEKIWKKYYPGTNFSVLIR